MQDLACPHTAKATIKYLKKEKIANMPRMPKGADCNPLDFFVWNSEQTSLNNTPKGTRDKLPKLQATLVRVINELRADPGWVGKVKKACESAPKRMRWVASNGGRQIVGRPWKNAKK